MARILTVDDDADIRGLLVTVLGAKGHELLQAADGADALQQVRRQHPDLVITDILMPVMDGYEFVRQMRNDPAIAGTPVIFHTAVYHHQEALALAEACGVVHILNKPTSLETIVSTVEAALGGKGVPVVPVPPASSEGFDREHLRVITNQLAREVEELRKVNGRLSALIEVSRRLTLESDPRRLLEEFCQSARDILAAKFALAGLLDPTGQALHPVVTSGGEATGIRLGTLSPRLGLFQRLLSTGEPIRVRDLPTDPEAAGVPFFHPPAKSFVGVTIASTSRVYGVLTLWDKLGTDEFSPQDEQVAQTLAAQLAVAYENARRYEEIQHHAIRLEHEVKERLQVEKSLEENRRRLQALFDNTQDAFLLLGDDTRIVDANPAACCLLGYSREQLLTLTWWSVAPRPPGKTRQESWRAFSQETKMAGEGAFLRLDGTSVEVEYRAVGNIVPAIHLAVLRDITEHKRAEEQLLDYSERLQSLSRQLLQAQETERRHIARELHDEIGQALTAVKINLQAMQRATASVPPGSRLEESIGIVEKTLDQVRNLSLDLRPSILDDLGLVAALRWNLDRQAKRAGFNAHMSADGVEGRLAPELETTCFRVVQEALTNVVRHARARQVWVELGPKDGDLELVIRDDGAGFDVTSACDRAQRGGSLGLLGLQERVMLLGGHCDLVSAPGRGTEIRVRFPWQVCHAVEESKADIAK
jgi:PAS domain S-box-containing protein